MIFCLLTAQLLGRRPRCWGVAVCKKWWQLWRIVGHVGGQGRCHTSCCGVLASLSGSENIIREEGLDVPVTNLKGLVTRSSSDILNIFVMLHFYGKGCRAQ